MTDDTLREYKKTFHSFLSHYPVRRFNRREVMLQQGEVPEAAYVIKSGIVKSYNLTPLGEEKPIAFNLSDEVFPIGWVLSRLEASQFYYEALTDCEIYTVPVNEYVRFLKTEPECLYELYRGLADRYVEYQMRINALEQSRASDKVLYTLNFLAHRFGKDLSQDLVKIQLPLTKQDMANFMGIARETTTIELKKLERKGVISISHRNYTIDTSKLKELIGEESGVSAKTIPQKQLEVSIATSI